MRNDKIIGALIGLVGAAGNSGWTEKTDQTIASALLQEDNDETIEEIHRRNTGFLPGVPPVRLHAGIHLIMI